MKKLMVTLAALLIASGAAQAQSAGWSLAYGSGNKTCAQWTASKKADGALHQTRIQWINGYLTAYSRWEARDRAMNENDPYIAMPFVDAFCRDNPTKIVTEAAEQLIYTVYGVD